MIRMSVSPVVRPGILHATMHSKRNTRIFFCTNGLTAVCTGKLCCQQSVSNPRPDSRVLSAGGTLLGAIYEAIETEPENKHSILVKQSGISNALDFKPETPQFAMDG